MSLLLRINLALVGLFPPAQAATGIVPLRGGTMPTSCRPQGAPTCAATQDLLTLRGRQPEYAYKEASPNPTDLRDRAADREADLAQQFRIVRTDTEVSGERGTLMGRSLDLSRRWMPARPPARPADDLAGTVAPPERGADHTPPGRAT